MLKAKPAATVGSHAGGSSSRAGRTDAPAADAEKSQQSSAALSLLLRVEALARRKYVRRSPLLVVGDLELDQAAKTVRRGGRDITLAPQLFALLELLMLRKGQVVSRTEIEEHIYDELASPMSNVVDTAVCALRRAIAMTDRSAPMIHTRRGMGYVMEIR